MKALPQNAELEDVLYHRYYEVRHGAINYPNTPDLWNEILYKFPYDAEFAKKNGCDACLKRWWDFFTSWTDVSICPAYLQMVEYANTQKSGKFTTEELIDRMREKCNFFSLWVIHKVDQGKDLHQFNNKLLATNSYVEKLLLAEKMTVLAVLKVIVSGRILQTVRARFRDPATTATKRWNIPPSEDMPLLPLLLLRTPLL